MHSDFAAGTPPKAAQARRRACRRYGAGPFDRAACRWGERFLRDAGRHHVAVGGGDGPPPTALKPCSSRGPSAATIATGSGVPAGSLAVSGPRDAVPVVGLRRSLRRVGSPVAGGSDTMVTSSVTPHSPGLCSRARGDGLDRHESPVRGPSPGSRGSYTSPRERRYGGLAPPVSGEWAPPAGESSPCTLASTRKRLTATYSSLPRCANSSRSPGRHDGRRDPHRGETQVFFAPSCSRRAFLDTPALSEPRRFV